MRYDRLMRKEIMAYMVLVSTVKELEEEYESQTDSFYSTSNYGRIGSRSNSMTSSVESSVIWMNERETKLNYIKQSLIPLKNAINSLEEQEKQLINYLYFSPFHSEFDRTNYNNNQFEIMKDNVMLGLFISYRKELLNKRSYMLLYQIAKLLRYETEHFNEVLGSVHIVSSSD